MVAEIISQAILAFGGLVWICRMDAAARGTGRLTREAGADGAAGGQLTPWTDARQLVALAGRLSGGADIVWVPALWPANDRLVIENAHFVDSLA